MAADRNDTAQENYFRDCPEAVFRLIENTLKATQNHQLKLSICGDFRNKVFLERLLKLGIRHFSTAIHYVQDVACLVDKLNKDNDIIRNVAI
jgi:phosphoenolpyruvate-protein kinase (PTS system EI component)